eukprot:533328_1
MITIIIYLLIYKNFAVSAATTPPTTDGKDLCGRDILKVNEIFQTCGMTNLNNVSSYLLDFGVNPDPWSELEWNGIYDINIMLADRLEAGIIWQNKLPFLLLIYSTDSFATVYADVFDVDGNHIVANHVIIKPDIEPIRFELVLKSLPSVDSKSYSDILDFLVFFRIGYTDTVWYMHCHFTGESIENSYSNIDGKLFINQMQSYTISYLFNSDSFILFGNTDYIKMENNIIVFDINGTVFAENNTSFVPIHGPGTHTITCGFNTTHDVCFINTVIRGTGHTNTSIISINLLSDQSVHITNVATEFNLGPSPSIFDYQFTPIPVVITPSFNQFFVPIVDEDDMNAKIYDLTGNIIVNISTFIELFNYTKTSSFDKLQTPCYSSYLSGVIVCVTGGLLDKTFIFDSNGNQLMNNSGLLLDVDVLNSYLRSTNSTYSHLGNAKKIMSQIKLVPLTSNDFWAIFVVTFEKSDSLVLFGTKMSLYDDCCNSYINTTELDISTTQLDISTTQLDISTTQLDISTTQLDISTTQLDIYINDETDNIGVPALIGIIVGVIIAFCLIVIVIVYFAQKKRTNNAKSMRKSANDKKETRYSNVPDANDNDTDIENDENEKTNF